jgi:hypothetical protein
MDVDPEQEQTQSSRGEAEALGHPVATVDSVVDDQNGGGEEDA